MERGSLVFTGPITFAQGSGPAIGGAMAVGGVMPSQPGKHPPDI